MTHTIRNVCVLLFLQARKHDELVVIKIGHENIYLQMTESVVTHSRLRMYKFYESGTLMG